MIRLSLKSALFVALLVFGFELLAQTASESQAQVLAQEELANEQSQAGAEKAVNDYAENYAFEDASQRKVFLELTEVLRCPMCQNQNIADSDAMIAHDMRRKVYQLMQRGEDKQGVIDFMKQRYGDFVYYQPPVNSVTIWLWLLPILFAFVMLFAFILRKKKAVPQDMSERLARANRLLKEDE